MDCDNCKKFIVDITISKNKYLVTLVGKCSECNKKTIRNIKYNIRRKNIIPIHLLNYNYCGPFTDVLKNIIYDIKPYNELDKRCQIHDLSYHMYKDNYHRFLSDIYLIDYINKMKKKDINSNIIKFILSVKNMLNKF
jgi:hypothetical protein